MRDAALIADLFDAGVDAALVARVAKALASAGGEKSKAALRTEKWRAKKASQNVTEASPRDVTKIITERHETSPDRHRVTSPRTCGEDNLSRLEITGLVVVGGVDARKPDQQTDDWPMGNAKRHAELLVETVASPWLDPQKSGGLVLTTGRLDAWKRQGASWEHDVLPVVTSATAGRRSKINGWTYFDDAIANSIAANRKALEIPEAGRAPRGQGPPSITERIGSEIAEAKRRALEQLSAQNG